MYCLPLLPKQLQFFVAWKKLETVLLTWPPRIISAELQTLMLTISCSTTIPYPPLINATDAKLRPCVPHQTRLLHSQRVVTGVTEAFLSASSGLAILSRNSHQHFFICRTATLNDYSHHSRNNLRVWCVWKSAASETLSPANLALTIMPWSKSFFPILIIDVSIIWISRPTLHLHDFIDCCAATRLADWIIACRGEGVPWINGFTIPVSFFWLNI